MKQQTVHFKGLNALRFIAAFLIIFYHSTLPFQNSLPDALKMLLHNLPLGVDFFFLISGFLIVYLLMAEKEAYNTISLKKFYLRRVLRIFPLYYLIVAIAWFQYKNQHPELDFTPYLYFWENMDMVRSGVWPPGLLVPLWSICIEEHFYLVIPLLVLLIPNNKLHWLFLGIIFISIGFRIYITLTIEYNWMTIYAHTLSRCDVLAIGGLLAWVHRKKPIEVDISIAFLFGALLYLVLLLCAIDYFNFVTVYLAAFKKYLILTPLVFLFLYLLFNKNTALDRFRDNRMLDYLGKISYGLYMYHTPMDNLLFPFKWLYSSFFLKPLALFSLTILVSALSYELLEKQILKWKKRFEVIETQNTAMTQPSGG